MDGIDETSKGGNRPVPPYAEMMGTLQVLRRSDPVLYQRVQREVITSLQAAGQAANDAFDIRELAKRRRSSRASIADRLNHLAYLLLPTSMNR